MISYEILIYFSLYIFVIFRDAWSRPRPRDYRGPVRDRGYSPGMESAPKRMRHDFYGDAYYNHYQPYHQPAHR